MGQLSKRTLCIGIFSFVQQQLCELVVIIGPGLVQMIDDVLEVFYTRGDMCRF
jgi:hypothetical protein